MPENAQRSRYLEPAFLIAFAAYLVLYQLLCYHGTFTRGDDFAYMESVAETLARGRLFTHDFIGPHNAFLTAASAAVYLSTGGNFYLATYGLLALFAAAVFVLFYALFRDRFGPWPSAGWAMVTATFPLYLHKSLDYHGALPTLACFLGSLFAYRSGRLALFFLLATLAISDRQNGLVLFGLPLFDFVLAWRAGRKPDARAAAYLALSLLALGALRATMNVNWFNANLHVLPASAKQAGLVARQIAVAQLLGAGFLSLAGIAVGGVRPLETLRANLRRPWLPLAASLTLLLLAFGSRASLVWFQTPLIGSLDHGGRLQILLTGIVLISLWLIDRGRLKPDAYLFLGMAYLAISSLLGFMWDYYLAEPALLAMWIALRDRPEDARPLPFAPALCAAALAINLGYACLYKVLMDKNALADVAFERLERKGLITPERMTGATFGYMGFKLFTLIRDDNPHHEKDDFTCFVQGDGAVVESGSPWRRALPPSAYPALDSGTARIAFARVRWRVVDHGNPAGENACHEPFRGDARTRTRTRSRPYPLSNAEWREFIAAAARKGA